MNSEKYNSNSISTKFNRKESKNSNTNSNSVRSGVGVSQYKQMRKQALQKKSTLLFIQDNNEKSKTPILGSHRRNDDLISQNRDKSMMNDIMSNKFSKSRSFKPRKSIKNSELDRCKNLHFFIKI